jgi:undecaprenyl-diphosphatase
MNSAAEFLGEHAITTLIVASVLMLIATAIVWKLIDRFWEPLWRLVARVWGVLSRSILGDWLRRVPLLRGSLARTLSVWRYLGIHAILSFAFALTAIGAFVELADEIDSEEELALFDARLTHTLQSNVDLPTLELFATITHLGDRNVTVGIGILVGLYLLWRRWWLQAVVWALATGLGGVLVRLLKHHFERTRPIHEHALTDSTGWSFPSGHAAGAMLIYGMLGYFIIRHTPSRWHIPIALVTIVLITFVGFSRVILQVHYFSDVLAGFAVAGGWIALCVTAFEVIRRRGSAGEKADVRRQESLTQTD